MAVAILFAVGFMVAMPLTEEPAPPLARCSPPAGLLHALVQIGWRRCWVERLILMFTVVTFRRNSTRKRRWQTQNVQNRRFMITSRAQKMERRTQVPLQSPTKGNMRTYPGRRPFRGTTRVLTSHVCKSLSAQVGRFLEASTSTHVRCSSFTAAVI